MSLFHLRSGAFSPEKTVALVVSVLPAAWLAALALQGGLGARPWTEAIHFTGLWALRFLVLGLAVTPVRRMLRWPRLFFARRILGLAALAYAAGHVILFFIDQGVGRAASEIVLRLYLTIGAVAVLLLVVLGATSYDGAIRRLGAARWNRIHAAVYLIAVLAAVHFFIQSKLDVTEPVLMAGALVFLFACRIAYRFGGDPGPARLAGLAVAGAIVTGLLEMAWYGLATRVDPLRVAQANFAFDLGLRPVWWVLAGGLAAAGLAWARSSGRDAAAPAARPRSRAAGRAGGAFSSEAESGAREENVSIQ